MNAAVGGFSLSFPGLKGVLLLLDALHELVAYENAAEGFEHGLESSVDITEIVGDGACVRVFEQQLAHYDLVFGRQLSVSSSLALDIGEDLFGQLYRNAVIIRGIVALSRPG